MKAIVCFQGFTESEDHRTGTEDLYFNVIRKFADEFVTTYQPRTWTCDVQALAYQINRQGIRHVAVVSYSHGQAATRDFARECYDLGIRIDLWLACDPVYRPSWLPRWDFLQPFSFRAMGVHDSATIIVPSNIRRVCGVRQEVNRPQVHKLEAKGGNTRINRFTVLPYGHCEIDEAPEWFHMVESELRHWIKPPHAEPV
jgi:hypothetical protein